MFISLKISHTSANRVEYTLTSVNKDLQTSITMLPTKVTRFKTYTRKLQKIYYKVFYVCSKLCEICNQSLHRWIHKPLLVSTCLLTFTNQFSFNLVILEKMILRLQKLTSMNFCTEDLVVRAFSITFPDVL